MKGYILNYRTNRFVLVKGKIGIMLLQERPNATIYYKPY